MVARSRLPVLLGSAAVVVLLVVLAGWYVVDRGALPFLAQQRSVVTLGISLVPDATGTVVEVVGESADDSLPARLDLDLTPVDDAALIDGGPATGRQLQYSDVQDGLGNPLPAEQVRAARLRDVGTDGRRLRLSFHIAAVDGRRVIYPIPRSPRLGWVRARLYVSKGTVTCWGDAPSGESAFGACAGSGPNEIDGTRHAAIRLELRAATRLS